MRPLHPVAVAVMAGESKSVGGVAYGFSDEINGETLGETSLGPEHRQGSTGDLAESSGQEDSTGSTEKQLASFEQGIHRTKPLQVHSIVHTLPSLYLLTQIRASAVGVRKSQTSSRGDPTGQVPNRRSYQSLSD